MLSTSIRAYNNTRTIKTTIKISPKIIPNITTIKPTTRLQTNPITRIFNLHLNSHNKKPNPFASAYAKKPNASKCTVNALLQTYHAVNCAHVFNVKTPPNTKNKLSKPNK
jgi:hypothetical protein